MTNTLPNLLIVGAAKAGTTSLHEYLDLHPDVFMSRPKELKFFYHDDWRERLDWYRAKFPVATAVRGESTPAYSMHPWLPGVPERVAELIPHAKLIYMVRDPVERLLAHYVEFYALHLEHSSLAVALADLNDTSNVYVMTSRYAYQLERYREFFPDSQILVVDQRELLERRRETLRDIFEFLGVDAEFDAPEFDRLHNPRRRKVRLNRLGARLYKGDALLRLRRASRVLPEPLRERTKRLVSTRVETPALDDGLRAELEDCLRDDADRLRRYTGKPLRHWSV